MSFFPEDPAPPAEPDVPEEPVEPDPWEGPPDGAVPAVLPVAALLGATEHAAVVLTGVRVFPTGVELGVEARLRRAGLSDDEWDDLLDRAGGFGARLHRSRRNRGGGMRIGVALPDSDRVVADDGPPDDAGGPPRPVLRQLGGGGSGSDRSWVSSWRYWLWPLPPDGPLTVVVAWPQLGLAETRLVVDGSDLAAVAARARPVWPDAAPLHTGPQPSWSVTFSE